MHATKTLAQIGILSALAVSAAGAQTVEPPTTTKSCGGFGYIGGELHNPFTAERVHESVTHTADGKEKTTEFIEFVARDNEGRIRFEKNSSGGSARGNEEETLHTRDGETFSVTREELGIVVLIMDCPRQRVISVQPGMRIARIRQRPVSSKAGSQERPFSFGFTSMLRGRTLPDVAVEDLGYKELGGIKARGIRITTLGKDEDGEWKGKPIHSDEMWLSDSLAAMVLRTYKDFKKGVEGTESLVNIKRDEPEASLFEIPPGYKVDPTPGEMPFSMGSGSPKPKTQP